VLPAPASSWTYGGQRTPGSVKLKKVPRRERAAMSTIKWPSSKIVSPWGSQRYRDSISPACLHTIPIFSFIPRVVTAPKKIGQKESGGVEYRPELNSPCAVV